MYNTTNSTDTPITLPSGKVLPPKTTILFEKKGGPATEKDIMVLLGNPSIVFEPVRPNLPKPKTVAEIERRIPRMKIPTKKQAKNVIVAKDLKDLKKQVEAEQPTKSKKSKTKSKKSKKTTKKTK